jgi:hypothetical protein
MLISAPNFMKECDVIIDPSFGPVDFSQDFSNKKVFLNLDYFEQVLPKLLQSSGLTLVVHHSDRFFDRIMFEAVRPCTSRILARNCDWSHPLVTQIPIGFVDAAPTPSQFMTKIKIDEKLLKSIRDSEILKDVDMYVNISLHGSETKFASVRALRQKCLESFPCGDKERRSLPEFLQMLRRSKYVACPMGFGIDTHRFFEAAYMKARPVVISSGLDPLYRKFGAVILDKWSDALPEWTEPDVPEELFHTGFWMII